MLQFFKYVLATIVGLLLFGLLSLFLMIGIGTALSSGDDKVTVEENSVLKLDLNKPIVDQAQDDNPFAELGGPFAETARIGMIGLKKSLANAKLDPNIKGIYLQAGYPQAGWATLEEVRKALLDFRKAGKFVYSYGEIMTEKGYYLSSAAERIYLNPAGGMEFNGLSAEYEFFKGTLEKLEIKPVIFRVGQYKSAVEPFFRTDMSKENKAQTRSFLGSIHTFVLGNIAKSRGVTVPYLMGLKDSLLITTPQSALKYKLITHVGYYDEFENDLKKTLKLKDDKKIEFIGLSKYEKAEDRVEEGDGDNRIAVILSSGAITSGKGGDGEIGSDRVAADLRKARKDKKVKAVVLRIDSPGGSALASDVIWREVVKTREVKPVIASMGDYAASGGYYMAMGCTKIVAEPTTITGSIGIFGALFNFQNFLKNKLGITTDRVGTNAHADWPSVTREMTDFEKNVIQQQVNRGYEIFTMKAAQGRKMPIAKLKEIAGGRVWSGTEAKQNGLVDVLGGLDDAIRLAAQEVKLKPGQYRVRYPVKKSFFNQLFDKAGDEQEARLLKAQFGDLAPYVKEVQKLKTTEGIQARMPYLMDIE
ncbi:MAG: signal peptide peptidase SppA [Cytophagaceae bacterium]|nr:signal peptide peptidase SppA [Cytophagaceae bacterium]